MVGSGILHNETVIALHALVDGGLLNSPLANVCPLLLIAGRTLRILCGVGRLPSRVPALAELLKEVGLDGGRLEEGMKDQQLNTCIKTDIKRGQSIVNCVLKVAIFCILVKPWV